MVRISATGNVTSDGGDAVTDRGVCWNTGGTPTTADTGTADGTGTGAFTSTLASLTAGTTYYVRAYATNSIGTSYGSEVSFTTDTTPTVTTTAISNIATTIADSGGNVTADGGVAVTARGVCWGTSANPTTVDSKTTDGTGTGVFTSSITGLLAGTSYHVRAHATNSIGTAYGSDIEFTAAIAVTTSGGSAAVVIDGDGAVVDPDVEIAASDITGFMVSITANFSMGDVLAYTGAPPGGVSASYAGATGVFSFSGTASAAEWQALLRTVTFSTSSASTATRTIAFTAGGAIPLEGYGHYYQYVASPNINWTNSRDAAALATLFGLQGYLATITSQEENDFIEQKLAADAWIGGSDGDVEDAWKWVTGPESGTQFSNGSTPVGGQFANWNAIEPNNAGGTEHFLETYSSGGGKWNDLADTPNLDGYVVEYGGMAGDSSWQITDARDVTVSAPVVPTVTTATVSDVTVTTATCGGSAGSDRRATVTARGVCWSTSANPTTADSKTTDGTGTGAFTSSVTGLTPSTTYYLRAYATNSVGVSYGGDESFTTVTGDRCPADPYKNYPGVCGCGVADIDTDGDGTLDCNDDCPDDIDKTDAGACGCGVADTDTDDDDTPDCTDNCPGNPDKTEPGLYGCNGEATTDENQTAEVNNDAVDATIRGFEQDTYVTVWTDVAGATTLTATDSDGESVLTVHADGLGDGARIDMSVDESGNPTVTMTYAGGATLMVNTMHYPAGIEIYGARNDQNRVVVSVTDDSGVARTVALEAIGADRDIVINVIYNMPEKETGQVVPSFDRTVMDNGNELAVTDSVTIEAVGLLESAVTTVGLEYWEADYTAYDESELRLHRLDEETGEYMPTGTNDMGDMPPTQSHGDYGIDTRARVVWGQVNEMGTFAIASAIKNDYHVIIRRGPMCGVLGMVPIAGLLFMPLWILSRHKMPTASRNGTCVRMRTKREVRRMNKGLLQIGWVLLAMILLAANSGCGLRALVPGQLLSFGAGWLLGQSSVSATTECYINGVPIDCGSLPD